MDVVQVWKDWRERRFLKQHSCDTREEYDHKYDPEYNPKGYSIRDYYHGYPYFHCFDNIDHYAYRMTFDCGPGGRFYGLDNIRTWIAENCQNKRRVDFLSVTCYNNEYEQNSITGENRIFIAFQDQQDYLLFLLEWS